MRATLTAMSSGSASRAARDPGSIQADATSRRGSVQVPDVKSQRCRSNPPGASSRYFCQQPSQPSSSQCGSGLTLCSMRSFQPTSPSAATVECAVGRRSANPSSRAGDSPSPCNSVSCRFSRMAAACCTRLAAQGNINAFGSPSWEQRPVFMVHMSRNCIHAMRRVSPAIWHRLRLCRPASRPPSAAWPSSSNAAQGRGWCGGSTGLPSSGPSAPAPRYAAL